MMIFFVSCAKLDDRLLCCARHMILCETGAKLVPGSCETYDPVQGRSRHVSHMDIHNPGDASHIMHIKANCKSWARHF